MRGLTGRNATNNEPGCARSTCTSLRTVGISRQLRYLGVTLAVAGLLSACAGRDRQNKQDTEATEVASQSASSEAGTDTAPQEDVELVVEWRASTGSLGRESVTLQPAVDGDVVYTASDKGRVSAFAAGDGETLWRVDLDEPVSAGVAAGDGHVFLVTAAGKLLALNAESGEQQWQHSVFSEVLAAPRVDSGTVVLRGNDGKVIGVQADTGERIWAYQRDVPALSLRGASSPLLHAGVAVTGFASGRVVANEVDDGEILWELSVAEARGHNEIERLIDIDSEPVLNGSVLYVAVYNGQLTALALGSRRMLWQQPISSHRNIAVDTNHVYITADDNAVHAIDRLNGESVWTRDLQTDTALNGPVILDGELLIGDDDGQLHLVDAVTGNPLAQAVSISKDPLLRGMVVSEKRGYVLSRSGDLYAVSLNRTPKN